MAPKFDPTQPYEEIVDEKAAPKFDPNAPFEEVPEFEKAGVPQETRASLLAKAYAAPVVGFVGSLTNIPNAAIQGLIDSYKNGTPIKQAYEENFKRLKEVQKGITESSMAAHYLGKVGEFGAAAVFPAKGVLTGAAGGAYVAASGGEDLEQQKELAKGGAIAGGVFGKLGKYVSEKIPSMEHLKEAAQEKAIRLFDSSKKFLKDELQYVKGRTADEKFANFGEHLIKRTLATNDKASMREITRQALAARNTTNDILNTFKQEAFKKNPPVDALSLYDDIKRVSVDMADTIPEQKFISNIFKDIHAITKKKYNAQNKEINPDEKSLKNINDIYEKIHKNYGYIYDKAISSRTPKEQRIIEGMRTLKNSIDDTVAKTLTEEDPSAAVNFAKTKMDYHLFEQTKELADDKIYQSAAKTPDVPIGNIRYAPFVAAGRAVQSLRDRITPSPGSMYKMAPYMPLAKDLAQRGQKVPYGIGQLGQEDYQE